MPMKPFTKFNVRNPSGTLIFEATTRDRAEAAVRDYSGEPNLYFPMRQGWTITEVREMNAEESERWLWDQSAHAAAEWFRMQSRDPYAQLYLHYKRGELMVFEEAPTGWMLGDARRIGPGQTQEQVKMWIHDVARKLPCLPEE